MRKNNMNRNCKRFLYAVIVFALITAMALTIVGCTEDESGGIHTFKFIAVMPDGTERSFDITTERKYVGQALLDEGLISGDDTQYGLFVHTVCGQTVRYETDGKFWSFYIGENMSMTGVDATEIVDGTTYVFKVE